MAKPKSQAEADYRRAASDYLRALKMSRGLTLKQLGTMAGGVEHSTIQRWVKMSHRPDLVGLEMIAQETGVPIPEDLPRLAREARRPPVVEATADEVESFLQSSPAWQRMVKLGRALAKETRPDARENLKRELEDLIARVR